MQLSKALRSVLTAEQANGVQVLIIISILSLVAVLSLLFIILLSAVKASLCKLKNNVFRSHVTAYLISLLVSDLLQAVGSIMNSRWVKDMAVSLGGFCSVQGAIKQAADIGTALWISVIAIHTFNVLVLGIQIRRAFMYLVLFGGWCFIGAVVTMGPFILQEPPRGPYFGISGYWCWIMKPYETEQFFLDYLIMFFAALTSFCLYMFVFLRLRGNLLVARGGRVRFRLVDRNTARSLHQSYVSSDLQAHMVSIAKHMLLYPIAYTILIVPIAACRFSEWTGHDVPLGVVVFSDSIFLLSGLVNTLLFVLTGRVLPLSEIREIFKFPTTSSYEYKQNVGMKEEVESDFDCDKSTLSVSSATWSDNTGYGLEKDLPQIPLESHSMMLHAPRVVSYGRPIPKVPPYSDSETSRFLGQG